MFKNGVKKMKTLILSDVHLGNPLFKHEKYLISLLENDEYDNKLYLMGDIFDVWEQDIDVICSRYKRIIKLLRKKDIVFITGNHDPDDNVLKEILPSAKICQRDILSIQKKNYVLLHGYQYDDMITKYIWFIRVLFIVQWLFERVGINIRVWFKNLCHSISNKRNKTYYNELVSDIELKAVEEHIGRFDGIIMGHTHSPKMCGTNDFEYVNCGDWVHSHTFLLKQDDVLILKHIEG